MSKMNVKSMEMVNSLIKFAGVKGEIKRIEGKLLEIKLATYLNKDHNCNVDGLINKYRELNNITLA